MVSLIFLLKIADYNWESRIFFFFFWRRCVFNEDIDFLQLAYAWVKDPERGINLSQGGNISLLGA